MRRFAARIRDLPLSRPGRASTRVNQPLKGELQSPTASRYASSGTMNGPWEDEGDGLHELIARSLRHRQALWALVLSTYRVELTQLLDHAARNDFAPVDRDLVIDVASRIAVVALEADLHPVRSDAISLRDYADAEPVSENGERRVMLAGLKLIDRILDIERARQNAEQSSSPTPPN